MFVTYGPSSKLYFRFQIEHVRTELSLVEENFLLQGIWSFTEETYKLKVQTTDQFSKFFHGHFCISLRYTDMLIC